MVAARGISVTVEHHGETPVIVVGGELDMATAPDLEAVVDEVLAEEPASLAFDLTAVDFMGSVGLRILVAAAQQIGATSRFAVIATGPAIVRPIELTGLDATLPLFPNVDKALAAVRSVAD